MTIVLSRKVLRLLSGVLAAVACFVWSPSQALAQRGQFDRAEVNAVDEAYLFTPPGFDREGRPAEAPAEESATLRVRVLDAQTRRPAFCRVNIVGADGNYYYPAADHLSPYRLTGAWPEGNGNRQSKAPIRYLGRFFYSSGEFVAQVPPGTTRVEVTKGMETAPASATVELRSGSETTVEIELVRAADVTAEGYYSGDAHLHFRRAHDEDDQLIFDLLEAEDIRYGNILCYNDDTNRYQGLMDQQASPQYRGLGSTSARARGAYHIISGQEYRATHYGHFNTHLASEMHLAQQVQDPNTWPVFGELARTARAAGAVTVHAHGGYAQEIWADAVLGNTDSVELLQFGIYRGIALEGWYHLLGIGLPFPAVGSSDYPACRTLGDCLTFVFSHSPNTPPHSAAWLRHMAAGRSFVTSGPLVLLEVDGARPGDRLDRAQPGGEAHVRLRVRSELAGVSDVSLVVGGKTLEHWSLPAERQRGAWSTFERTVALNGPTWIAARAWSLAPSGAADAEAHTNPVWLDVAGRPMFDAASAAWIDARLDEQLAELDKREFPQRERAVSYFRVAKDRLVQLAKNGPRTKQLPVTGAPR